MRAVAFASVLFVVTAVHCGGKTDSNIDGGSCPSDMSQSCTNGTQCSFPETLCGIDTTETCDCQNGQWACPLYQDCPVHGCPQDVYAGLSCSQPGLSCPAMYKPTCVDFPTYCDCDGTQFQCAVPDCPVPACPPPDQVVPGDPCSGAPDMMCNSSAIADCDGGVLTQGASCSCVNGMWVSNVAIDCDGGAPPPMDAGKSD